MSNDRTPDLPLKRSSFQLLASAQAGDEDALDQLYRRYLPHLTRWARGRLPRWARDLVNTEDVVQETMMQSLRHVEHIEYRSEGAFQRYLRTALKNRIRNEIRKAHRTPLAKTLGDETARQPTPLEALIGREAVEVFETAFAQLNPKDQEAITARLEMGLKYQQVAEALELASPDAARMAVKRAIQRLVQRMSDVKRD